MGTLCVSVQFLDGHLIVALRLIYLRTIAQLIGLWVYIQKITTLSVSGFDYLSMSTSDQSDAQEIADILEDYTRHKPSCTYNPSLSSTPRGDFCTCGLSDAVERVNEILDS